MDILQSIALLAISFVAIFCSMEILWRLLLGKHAAELKQQEKEKNYKNIINSRNQDNEVAFYIGINEYPITL
jgi:hypothetical protein